MSLANSGQLLQQARSTRAAIGRRAGRTPSQNSARAEASQCSVQKRAPSTVSHFACRATRAAGECGAEHRGDEVGSFVVCVEVQTFCVDPLSFIDTAKTEKGMEAALQQKRRRQLEAAQFRWNGLLTLKKRHAAEDSNRSFGP